MKAMSSSGWVAGKIKTPETISGAAIGLGNVCSLIAIAGNLAGRQAARPSDFNLGDDQGSFTLFAQRLVSVLAAAGPNAPSQISPGGGGAMEAEAGAAAKVLGATIKNLAGDHRDLDRLAGIKLDRNVHK